MVHIEVSFNLEGDDFKHFFARRFRPSGSPWQPALSIVLATIIPLLVIAVPFGMASQSQKLSVWTFIPMFATGLLVIPAMMVVPRLLFRLPNKIAGRPKPTRTDRRRCLQPVT